jgi:hypothetical protein
MLNWNLIKHPANWAIILLMLLIAAYGGHLVLTYFGANPAVKEPVEQNRNDIAAGVLE